MVNNYYISQKPKLLKNFDKTADIAKDVIVSRYGEDFADTLYKETQQEFEALIPHIPYIGSRAPTLTKFLIISAQELAVYKVMRRHGKTVQEAWELCHEALMLRLNKVPRLVRWLAKHLFFSNFMKKRIRKVIGKTQEHPIGDFALKFVEGDGKNFDFGVDYTECSIYKFMCTQGAKEFAPYVCLSDIPLGYTFGWGLIRNETLADGCKRCNFRFKKGGKTKISSTVPEVEETINKILK